MEVDSAGRLEVWIVPPRHRGRIPARGTCLIIDENGRETVADLCDVSFDGIRLHCRSTPPEVATTVQMVIESPALGGIDGRFGVVRWCHGTELGVGFQGNFDEAVDLVRFVQAFADAAEGVSLDVESAIDPSTRALCAVTCRVHLGAHAETMARTVDLSMEGAQIELELVPTVDWRDEVVTLRLRSPQEATIRGRVVRQAGRRLGVLFDAEQSDRQVIVDLVRASVLESSISTASILEWLVAHGCPTPHRVTVIEAIPRSRDGVVDRTELRHR
ncbi:MAG: PilZ domain-containing protein [Planctomycetota bacterium]